MATKFTPKKNKITGTKKKDKITWVSKNGWRNALTVNAGNGNDIINFKKSKYKNKLNGQKGNDKIYGGKNSDTIKGGDGNDSIYGFNGNDKLYGDSGKDTIYGGNGNDYIKGESGNDKIYGGKGNDKIYAFNGNDYIDGGDGKDKIYADYGNNTVIGGKGNDILYNGIGKNKYIFRKGDGKDNIIINDSDKLPIFYFKDVNLSDLRYTTTDGNDLVITYSKNDYIRIKNYFGTVMNSDYLLIGKNNEKNYLSKIAVVEYYINTDTNFSVPYNNLSSFIVCNDINSHNYNIFGSECNDVIYGGTGKNTIYGGKGDDVIYGGNGKNTLYGGEGNNTIIGGEGNNVISGDKGNDVLFGGNGKNTIYGGDGNNTIYGGDGYNKLFGDKGDDVIYTGNGTNGIYAGEGNDTIIAELAGTEDDYIYGDEGDDTIINIASSGHFGFSIGAGNDTLYLQAPTNNLKFSDLNNVQYYWNNDDLVISYASNDTVTIKNYNPSDNNVIVEIGTSSYTNLATLIPDKPVKSVSLSKTSNIDAGYLSSQIAAYISPKSTDGITLNEKATDDTNINNLIVQYQQTNWQST